MNTPIEVLYAHTWSRDPSVFESTPVVLYADHCAALEEKEQLRANAVARCDTLLKALEQSTATSERLLAERDALKYANDVVQKLQAEIMRTPCAPRGRWDDILPSSL